MVANQWATLDFVSGGRAILAVGLGRDHHYRHFEVPVARRVRRFREEVELIRALWTEDQVTYHGQFYQLENVTMAPRPVRKPLPISGWALATPTRCAARRARRWLDGLGRLEHRRVRASVPILKQALEAAGRDPTTFPDLEAPVHGGRRAAGRGARELHRWFTEVYHNPPGTDASGIHGTPEQVRERLEDDRARRQSPAPEPDVGHAEQLEALAELAGSNNHGNRRPPAHAVGEAPLPERHSRPRWQRILPGAGHPDPRHGAATR